MLPMVVAGGLMIALSFVFGITAFKEEGTLAAALMQIGGETAFKLMVPLLAGYIAYSIADRPGLAPGMIGGCWRVRWVLVSSAASSPVSSPAMRLQAISRYVALPQSLEALKPILIIPLLASLFTGLVMIYVVGKPVAGMLEGAHAFPRQHGHHQRDPARRAARAHDVRRPRRANQQGFAYAFSVGLLASQSYAPMAATMAAGMVPPIGLGIATFIARRKFAQSEREAGKAALVLGLCFISEGAIPFAAKDPLRVIPASIAGGALTGALSMYLRLQADGAPWRIVRDAIPNAINHALLYLLAIVAGVC
jgi:PTS system fructose-specific IIC component